MICLRCGRPVAGRPHAVLRGIACPYCTVDVDIRLCPECAKEVFAQLAEQLAEMARGRGASSRA